MKERSSAMKYRNSVYLFFHKLVILGIAFGLVVGIPLVVLLSVPLIIVRLGVVRLAQLFKPELGKIVTARGNICLLDDVYNKTKCTLVVSFILDGAVTLDRMRELFDKNVLNARFADGELKYPELKQSVAKFAGYWFWKDDPTFDLRDHLKYDTSLLQDPNSNQRVNDKHISDLSNKMLTRKWNKDKPLWEIVLMNNYYSEGGSQKNDEPCTCMALRMHHALGDGNSILQMFVESLAQTEIKNAKPVYPTMNLVSRIISGITFPFRILHDSAENLALGLLSLPLRCKNGKGNPFLIDVTDSISVSRIKEIKNHYGVSFSGVVFAIITGAIRDNLIRKGISELPKQFPAITAYPMKGHSEKLRNFLTGAFPDLPVSEPDPVQRLLYCSKNYERIRRSATPIFVNYLALLTGSLPPCISKLIIPDSLTSVGVSNFPVGSEPIYISSHKVLEVMFTGGLGPGTVGLGVTALSYRDSYRITFNGHGDVFSKKELRTAIESIHEQVDLLYQSVLLDP